MAGPIVYPGADYRQLAGKSTKLLVPTVINIHTMVGTLGGSESWFTPSGRAYSHFGLGGSGAIRQWQDLRFRAAADLDGNPYCISIETEDMGLWFPSWSGSAVPHFTKKQVPALVKLLAWLCTKFVIRRVLLTTSCQRDGISYHRLGCDPYRKSGCTPFSRAYGKSCPGDNKILDIKSKIMPALSGVSVQPKEWDEMATKAEVQAALEEVLIDQTSLNRPTANRIKARVGEALDENREAPAYFAKLKVPEDASPTTIVYYVAGNHQSKIAMGIGSPLHDFLKFLHATSNLEVNAVELEADVLNGIPTADASV